MTIYVIKHPTLPIIKLGVTKHIKNRLRAFKREYGCQNIDYLLIQETNDYLSKEWVFHNFHINDRVKYKNHIEYYPESMTDYLIQEVLIMKNISSDDLEARYRAKRTNN